MWAGGGHPGRCLSPGPSYIKGLVGREGVSQGHREDMIVGRREQSIVSRSFQERGVKKGRELSPVSYGFSDIIRH